MGWVVVMIGYRGGFVLHLMVGRKFTARRLKCMHVNTERVGTGEIRRKGIGDKCDG
jgi:hypothetical protein